jgi:hypothetical protein
MFQEGGVTTANWERMCIIDFYLSYDQLGPVFFGQEV